VPFGSGCGAVRAVDGGVLLVAGELVGVAGGPVAEALCDDVGVVAFEGVLELYDLVVEHVGVASSVGEGGDGFVGELLATVQSALELERGWLGGHGGSRLAGVCRWFRRADGVSRRQLLLAQSW
jgi:hypothetical protein